MTSERPRNPLNRVAGRAEAEPFFVAFALAAYRDLAGMDGAALTGWLRATGDLDRLALCRRPNGDSPRFAAEVEQIAAYASVDPGRLASLLRAVENAELMRAAPNTPLLAARDRERGGTAADWASGGVAGGPEAVPPFATPPATRAQTDALTDADDALSGAEGGESAGRNQPHPPALPDRPNEEASPSHQQPEPSPRAHECERRP